MTMVKIMVARIKLLRNKEVVVRQMMRYRHWYASRIPLLDRIQGLNFGCKQWLRIHLGWRIECWRGQTCESNWSTGFYL
ncbi:hypothetical protein EJD97_003573, partial [Solanum chilense]